MVKYDQKSDFCHGQDWFSWISSDNLKVKMRCDKVKIDKFVNKRENFKKKNDY